MILLQLLYTKRHTMPKDTDRGPNAKAHKASTGNGHTRQGPMNTHTYITSVLYHSTEQQHYKYALACVQTHRSQP